MDSSARGDWRQQWGWPLAKIVVLQNRASRLCYPKLGLPVHQDHMYWMWSSLRIWCYGSSWYAGGGRGSQPHQRVGNCDLNLRLSTAALDFLHASLTSLVSQTLTMYLWGRRSFSMWLDRIIVSSLRWSLSLYFCVRVSLWLKKDRQRNGSMSLVSFSCTLP